jgi:DNA-binding transcriptional regulator GbsR (MarR family)
MNAVNHDDVRRFIERFALMLAEAGLARMPARVFACVLAEDSGRLTAAELAERLEVSPAAISGAVRYLTQVGMLEREREPGARRDHYRLHDDVWGEMYVSRMAVVDRWERAMAEGAELLGEDRPAGRRMRESQEFFAFVREELPAMLRRWRNR